MTTALSRMIRQQAAALDRISALDVTGPAEVLAGARRVILVGTGTSQHAAELGAMMLGQAGLDTRWYPAQTWARWTAGAQPGDALLVISHTAETAYAARARAAALAAGVPVVSVTGAGRGWPEAVETVPPEESHTYSVSYTAALAVLARLAHQLGAVDGSPAQVRQAAAEVQRVCAAGEGAGPVAVPARSLALAGCGPWGVTAREGALKVREAARMLAEGFDSERLLHGPAVPLTAADGLVLLEPAADPDGLTAALGAAAQAEGIPVAVLAAADVPAVADVPAAAVPATDGSPAADPAAADQPRLDQPRADPPAPLPPLLAQIPMTVRLQLLAAWFAALRRQDPDTAITGAWADQALWELGAPGHGQD